MIKPSGYKILKMIGKGGVGDVYLAEHKVLETTVAIILA
jgi:serine/threonine protein kinase